MHADSYNLGTVLTTFHDFNEALPWMGNLGNHHDYSEVKNYVNCLRLLPGPVIDCK